MTCPVLPVQAVRTLLTLRLQSEQNSNGVNSNSKSDRKGSANYIQVIKEQQDCKGNERFKAYLLASIDQMIIIDNIFVL